MDKIDGLMEEYMTAMQDFREKIDELTKKAKEATDEIERIREKYDMFEERDQEDGCTHKYKMMSEDLYCEKYKTYYQKAKCERCEEEFMFVTEIGMTPCIYKMSNNFARLILEEEDMRDISIQVTLQDVAEIKETIYDYIILRRQENAKKKKSDKKTQKGARS